MRAAVVKMTSCRLGRQESERRSTRTGQGHLDRAGLHWTRGVRGRRDLAEFLPATLKREGRWVGVGRQSVWGKGEIKVEKIVKAGIPVIPQLRAPHPGLRFAAWCENIARLACEGPVDPVPNSNSRCMCVFPFAKGMIEGSAALKPARPIVFRFCADHSR